MKHRNEEEVGSALKKCGIPREEIYVITKVREYNNVRINFDSILCRIVCTLDLQECISVLRTFLVIDDCMTTMIFDW